MQESFCKKRLGDGKTRERFNMKGHIHSDDFGPLADKGWKSLSARLDKELPVRKVPQNGVPYRKIAVVLTLLCGVLLLSLLLSQQKTTRPPFQPIPKIVNNISFNVQQPDIVVNLLEPSAPIYLAEKKPVIVANHQALSEIPISKTTDYTSHTTIGLHYNNFSKYVDQLPTTLKPVAISTNADISSTKSQIKLQNLAAPKRLIRLGVNLSSSTRGRLQSTGVGGGISVSFPVGKRFWVEPGVGYDLARYNEVTSSNEGDAFAYARTAMASPSLNVKYRVRKSIEMPVSIHYQPIRQLALTGGVDVGLLISQRMVFESNGYSGLDVYKQQLNDSELNQLNRLNIGAHGGVSWFPSNDWKLGVYYGQNLTAEKKVKQQKLKFSNHVFKVRMARYF